MDERQSQLWQDLNSGAGTRYRAGHGYEARRPAPEARWRPALPSPRRLLAVAVAALPVIVGVLVVFSGG